jgi:KDO2-lipid IV(A) lauroyltransferase
MFNKYKIEYLLFISLGNLLSIFGFSSIKTTSKFLAFLFYYVIRVRRNVVIHNLSTAFPNLNEKEIKSLAIKNYQSIAITFLEIFNLKKLSREEIEYHFSNAGFDFVREKVKQKNGLILLTAHFGNWEIGAIASGIHLNDCITVLVKKQKNPFVASWLNNFRERFGNKQIFLGVSVRELYKTIKSNNIVGIVGDQRGTRDGISVDFFGRETRTFQGTAAIALKTNCPVIVLLCARQEDGKYKAIIKELDHSNFVGTTDDKIKQFNQKYMSILEDAIRKHPEQWFWMHNIWKY